MINKKQMKKCCKCERVQEISFKENVYQDISGSYLMCISCNELTPIEFDTNNNILKGVS